MEDENSSNDEVEVKIITVSMSTLSIVSPSECPMGTVSRSGS